MRAPSSITTATTPTSVHGGNSSSPDPLASSFHDNDDDEYESNITHLSSAAAAAAAAGGVRRHISPQRRSLSPSKSSQKIISKVSSLDYGVIPSSPFRTVSEQNISPWKIRVTVEAEPEEMVDDMDSNSGMTTTMTRTTKIPLRQDDSSPTASRGRKSQNNNSTAEIKGSGTSRTRRRRSATPVCSARGNSRSRRQSVTDLDVRPLGDDADSDDWTKQKQKNRNRKSPSPRKSRTVARKSGSASSATAAPADVDGDSSIHMEVASGAKRGSSSTADFEIRPDTDVEDDNAIFDQGDDTTSQPTESPELRHIDLNRVSVRHRAASTKSRVDEDMSQSVSSSHLNLQRLTHSSSQQFAEARKVSVNSAISYPTPSPTSSYHGESDDLGKLVDDEEQQQHHHDAATEMDVGFDTVLESEGFTMIDLDSIPSARQYRNTPVDSVEEEDEQVEDDQDNESGAKPPQHDTWPTPSSQSEPKTHSPSPGLQSSRQKSVLKYPVLNLDESDLSSTVPSSPPPPVQQQSKSLLSAPVITNRKVTPQICSSPKLPSPPKQAIRRTPHHAHRGSAGALFAGIALQDVVSPDHPSQSFSAATKESTPRSQDPDAPLFEGFDSSTKRELRAGLRFGEELAKRHSSSPAEKEVHHVRAVNPGHIKDLSKSQYHHQTKSQSQTQVWRGETIVQRTPVQFPPNPVPKDMDFGYPLVQTPDNRAIDTIDKSFLDTQARREKEWQLEREEIIRQIQNASESQVIVIDSSDDEEEVEQPSKHGERVQASNSETQIDHGSPGPSIEDGNEDYEDIWLAEAKHSSSPQGESHVDRRSGQEVLPRDHVQGVEVANAVASRPRRSLISSPWKRGDNINVPQDQSTFMTTNLEDQSGMLFWKETDNKVKFGAGEIRREKQGRERASGMFDVDIMAGTPRKDGPLYRRISFSSMKSAEAKDQELHENEQVPCNIEDSINAEHSNVSMEGSEESSLDPINNTFGAPEDVSSPEPPVRVVVNFNDSINEMATPPPRFPAGGSTIMATNSLAQSPVRPPTPRSALKGTRLSMAQPFDDDRSETPLAVRRVIWSERSRGVDVNGMESSFSMKSTTDDSIHDSVAGHLADQLNRELQASDASRPPQWDEEVAEEEQTELPDDETSELQDDETSEDITPTPNKDVIGSEQESKSQSGWRKWIWGSGPGSKADQETIDNRSVSSGDDSRLDDDALKQQNHQASVDTSSWTRTKTSIPSTTINTTDHALKIPSHAPRPSLPSYLLSPSYPSDPTRSTNTPLATSGSFTNTHFRTLHIIYRKSLRPRFHGPRLIRPCIRALLGKQMDIDESEAGVDRGVMTWTVGVGELEVLERFMQEVEWGYGLAPGPDAMGTSRQQVIWGWSPDELVSWLCRIVVGEVVREEEAKHKGTKAKAKAGTGAKAAEVKGDAKGR